MNNMFGRLKRVLIRAALVVVLLASGAYAAYRWYQGNSDSNDYLHRWLAEPEDYPEYESVALVPCGDAPFVLPTTGFIGLLWRDTAGPYNTLQRHTGIDIFGDGEPGSVPIYAAYDGYLTRLEDWKSSVIIRHDDPLQPGRIIWTYYTHIASRDGSESYIASYFPPGTYSKFEPQGTRLGYQGLYNPTFPVAMHLHFSIVTSEDDGSFKNEAILENTLDPTHYFGIGVNADNARHPVTCRDEDTD